jgi:hypothetical protein
MREMIKDLYSYSVDMWKNDRKEFWDMYLGFALVVFVFWVSFFVVIPIVGN